MNHNDIDNENEVDNENFEPNQLEDIEVINEDFSSEVESTEEVEATSDLSGTELDGFVSEEVEEKEFIESERVLSIVESVLFSTDKPQTVAIIKQAFRGTNVNTKMIRRAIDQLMVQCAGADRGFTLEEVNGGYQLRTKTDNMEYLRRMQKARPFKLSGPALEVLSIVAYKQPCAKIQVDEVRGVESGHLVRGLMEKNLLAFAGKSELPGKPMLYKSTKKFLEIFGLRNLDELPNLSEIDELIPEGMDPEEAENKDTLGEVASGLAQDSVVSYSSASDELEKIATTLEDISTSSDFFEQEKLREKVRREKERAQELREKSIVGEDLDEKDQRWLERYEAKLQEQEAEEADAAEVSELLESKSEISTVLEKEDEADANLEDDLALDFDTVMHMQDDSKEPDPIV